MKTIRIAPSILAANFLQLEDEIRRCEAAGADLIHCDVMDGHFVPNLTFGPPVIRQISVAAKVELDVHLMIDAPERSLVAYRDAGAAEITVHQEVSPHLHRTLSHIRALGARAGVALNPSTPVGNIESILDVVDTILIMTVNPGFGGQEFLPAMLPKIETAREWLERGRGDYSIAVDGGIDSRIAPLVVRAGADTLVAGSAVFKGDVAKNMDALREAVNC